MKLEDYKIYTGMSDKDAVSRESFRELYHGQTFDLGNRQMEIIELPGHTPGCMLSLTGRISSCFRVIPWVRELYGCSCPIHWP